MHKTYKIVVSTLILVYVLSFLSFPAIAQDSVEMTDTEILGAMEFGPGSDVPLGDPFESGYVWISDVEPVKAKWTIYDPGMHQVTVVEHIPSIKQKITSGEHTGKWAYGDRSAFTLPAFASKGTWLAKVEYEMADGTTRSGGSAEDPNVKYIGIPCTLSGDWFGNFFLYPYYFFGMKMPALFWFPFAFLWVPAVFILILIVWTRSVKGFAMVIRGAVNAGKEAIREARYTK